MSYPGSVMNRRGFLALPLLPLARPPARKEWTVEIGPPEEYITRDESDIRFYLGDQWPSEVRARRLAQGRPCLVSNRLPAIVRSLMAANPQANERRVVLEVVRQWRDAQLVVNYCLSDLVEMYQASFRKGYPPGFDHERAAALRCLMSAAAPACGKRILSLSPIPGTLDSGIRFKPRLS